MQELRIHFLLRLFFFSGAVFGLHLLALNFYEKQLFGSLLIEAYVTNISLAIVIYFALLQFRVRFKNQLGFLFLLGSVLKFILFFLIFNGEYKADGSISTQEFFAFFAPYTTTLIIEVFSLSKWMNKL